jgi:cephalosporin-C deacetylase-like acetyl esterase
MTILLTDDTIGDIPVLTLAPATARGRPLVFFVPGFGGVKAHGLSLGYQLALAGNVVVCIDPWLHGARQQAHLHRAADPQMGGIYPAETGLDTGYLFYQVIQRCCEDVRLLIEHFAADTRVDVSRCGVTGPSMGGCASYAVFAALPQIRAAVPMIGIPHFTQRWLDLLDECAFSTPEWAEALQRVTEQTEQRTSFIRSIDPSKALAVAAPRALLMMNCDFDTDQPKAYAIACYRNLQPAYAAQPDNLRLRIYPAAHVVTPEMERDAVEWFVRHLGV